MKRKTIGILALVLVFALMFTACAARRPLQNPVQPRQDTTGLYNNNRGTGSGTGPATGVGTRTGAGTGTYNGNGPSSNDPYDLGFGAGNNAGAGNNPGYGGYGATGTTRNYGGTGTVGNYGGAGTTDNNAVGGVNGYYGGGATGVGNPTYYGGYGGYGGYNNGMYGGYGNDYRNVGGGNNSPNYSLNNAGGTNVGMNQGTTQGIAQADMIARSLEQMVGVDSATVVVNGTTAYVGIDTDGDLTGRNISYGNATDLAAVKRACAQRVRSANPQIQTVYVSTDANFFERLRRVRNGANGGNTGGFTNELNTLIRGLTPERQQ